MDIKRDTSSLNETNGMKGIGEDYITKENWNKQRILGSFSAGSNQP